MPVKNMSIASYQQFSSFVPYRAFRWFRIRMNSICQRFSASRVATQESNDRQTPSFVFDPIQLPMGVCYLILLSHSLFSLIISHFNRLRHKSSVLHFSQRLNAKNSLFYCKKSSVCLRVMETSFPFCWIFENLCILVSESFRFMWKIPLFLKCVAQRNRSILHNESKNDIFWYIWLVIFKHGLMKQIFFLFRKVFFFVCVFRTLSSYITFFSNKHQILYRFFK